MANYRKAMVPATHSKDLLELYFTDKKVIDNMSSYTFMESIFLSFIETIIEYSNFIYITRYSDEIFIAWVRGKKSLVRFIRKSRLSNADKDKIKGELDELAKKLEKEYNLEATFVIHEKTSGGSELLRLNVLKRH